MAYGTLQVLDTIGTRKAAASDYLNTYDEAELYQQVQMFLDAHNLLVDQITMDLVEKTTDRLTTWGGNATVDMIDGSELSRPDVQKMQVSPTTLGFPLYLKQVAWGVTRLFMMNKTVKDLDEILVAIRDADIRDIGKAIRQALFNQANNLTYADKRTDGATIPLRRLLNADSTTIPPDPYGNTFDGSTHTHFAGYASGSFAVADFAALISNVQEHYLMEGMRVLVPKNLAKTVAALTGFYPALNKDLIVANSVTHIATPLDTNNNQDRFLGIFDDGDVSADVYVRPWMPSSYLFAYNINAPKPLRMRVRPGQSGNLQIAADIEMYPLRAQYMEREYGISVGERANGACLKTSASSYSAPAAWGF
jgi:hypothetical protein